MTVERVNSNIASQKLDKPSIKWSGWLHYSDFQNLDIKILKQTW